MSDLKVTDRRWWARGESAGVPEEPPTLKPTYIEELEARLAAREAELQDVLARYRGASDEFDQARTRLRKEVAKDAERSRRAVLLSLLDVLDNLDRAVASACDRMDDRFVQGVVLVQQQFVAVLDGLGVTRINPLGEPFDPHFHEAVATTPAEGVPDSQIIGVVRPGYLVGDEVLRPAMVAVARSEQNA